jgi:GNAT superfamily N-acetyltransferase
VTVSAEVLGLAEDANTHTPLGEGQERVVTDRFVLWMGNGSAAHWNVAQRFRFDAGSVDDVIAEVHDLLRQRGRHACTWEVGSSARPTGLPELLLDRGMSWDEPDPLQIGMVLDRPPPQGPDDVTVRPVETLADYAAVERIAHECFGMPAPADADIEAGYARYRPESSRRYVASVGGMDAAGASATFTPHGVVLNAGSTLPGYRGRGLYRALVKARWDDAAAAGTPVLVTQAGRMSRPILERLGFRRVCEIHALLDEFGVGA